MDYSVDVVGDIVAGAASHYCFDHTPFAGIVIPTPPPGGQPHSEGCSVIGSDGRTVTNE